LFVIFCGISAKAQIYHPFASENKVWSELTDSWPSWYTTFYKLQGDTIINSKVYKIVYHSYDSLMTYWSKTVFFIREDSNHKVYKFYNVERLIYDFSLLKGDSIDTGHTSGINHFYAYVDSVDSVLVNGAYRKRIIFNSWYNESWIEGIGSSMSPFDPFINNFAGDFYMKLICVTENDTLIYQNTLYNNCYIRGYSQIDEINSTSDAQIIISPNPIRTTASIKVTDNITFYRDFNIINCNGQTIKSGTLKDNAFSFSSNGLTSGLYFIIVKSDDKILSKKILIQK
jgi:hypothetical protein